MSETSPPGPLSIAIERGRKDRPLNNAEAAVFVEAAPLAITDEKYLARFDPDGRLHQATETEQFADALVDLVEQSSMSLKEAMAAINCFTRQAFDGMGETIEFLCGESDQK